MGDPDHARRAQILNIMQPDQAQDGRGIIMILAAGMYAGDIPIDGEEVSEEAGGAVAVQEAREDGTGKDPQQENWNEPNEPNDSLPQVGESIYVEAEEHMVSPAPTDAQRKEPVKEVETIYSHIHSGNQLRSPSPIEREYQCNIENCAFSHDAKAGLLQHHWTVHKGLKPFNCEWQRCQQKFGQKSHRDRHVVLRHIEKDSTSYECQWRGCKHISEEEIDLVAHVKAVHFPYTADQEVMRRGICEEIGLQYPGRF